MTALATVSNLQGVVAIDATTDFTCALTWDRTEACWGNNLWGQIGGPLTEAEPKPVAVTW